VKLKVGQCTLVYACDARSRGAPRGGNGSNIEVKKMSRLRKKTTAVLLMAVFMISTLAVIVPAMAKKPDDAGFDEFGYNYKARVFVGLADGVDRVLDGKVWGDPTYANDHLVMKWSKGWDDARFHGEPWGPDAWETNEWNGMSPGGSGETWHYKIIWVGDELEDSPYWRDGGYPIWGQFEVILSHGTADGEHTWETHAIPTGFGGPYK